MLSSNPGTSMLPALGYLGVGYGAPSIASVRRGSRVTGYGEEVPVDPATEAAKAQTTASILDIANKYLFGEDDPNVLLVKIENYKKMMSSFPGNVPPLRNFYANEIAKMQAKVYAAQQAQQVTADWRSLGMAAAGIGIVIGVAITGLLVAQSYKTVKRTNPRKRNLRRKNITAGWLPPRKKNKRARKSSAKRRK